MENFKILVVDDEEDFVKTLSDRMELRDIQADVALDGKQALEKFEAYLKEKM